MKNSLIAKIIIVIGVCALIAGGIVFFADRTDTSTKNQEDEKKLCMDDYENQDFKTVSIEHEGKTIELDFLNCTEETTTDKGKKYISAADLFTMELWIEESSSTSDYAKIVLEEYTKEPKYPPYKIIERTATTESNINYNIVVAYESDIESKLVQTEIFNMIFPIDENNVLHVRITYTQGELEDGFFDAIANSLTITE